MSTPPELSGADLARSVLNSVRATMRTADRTPQAKRRTPTAAVDRHGRKARDPAPLLAVIPQMVRDRGWTAGAAGGSVLDRWADLVGPDKAAHWKAIRYDIETRTLSVLADSPAWATTLRLTSRQILADLERLEAGAVRALDVRHGTAAAPDAVLNVPGPQRPPAPAAVAAPSPVLSNPTYQQLRQQMRERATARQTATDEATAAREEILRQHYNRLREPEADHRPPVEDEQALADAARARRLRDSHRAALAIARGHTVPLRTTRQPQPAPVRGAA